MLYSATKAKGSSIWFNFYRTREHLLTEHVSHKVVATYYFEALPDAMGFTGDLFFFEGNNITYGQNFICFSNYVHRTSRGMCSLLLFWSSSGVSHFGVQFFFAPISTRTCCPRNNQTSAELAYADRKGYCSSKCYAMHCNNTWCKNWNGKKQQIPHVLIQFLSFYLCSRRPCIFSWPMLLTAFWELLILLKILSVKRLSLWSLFLTKWWNFEM